MNKELEKIPDTILLKESRLEVGQLKAYIDELKYENYGLRKKNTALTKDNLSLRKTVSDLVKQNML